MKSRREVVNLAAVVSLLLGNFALSLNQVNISAIFTFGPTSHTTSISGEFDLTVYGLGILTAAFFLAYGLFELPGGVWAAKTGPKKIVIYGAAANAVGVFASAVSPQFEILVVSRFLAGLGFAIAFPSMLVLIVRYYRAGSAGFGVALLSVSTALGAAAGYFGWAVIGESIGWRSSLLLAAFIDVVVTVVMVITIPQDRFHKSFRFDFGHLKGIVANKALALLSVAFFGFGAAFGVVANFMVYYLEAQFGLTPGLAGGITSISVILPVISAPFTGRIYDRARNIKLLLAVPASMVSVGVAIASIDSIYASMLTVIIVGIAQGIVFTVGLATARELAARNPSYESATIAWVDSFSLFGASASPIYFSALVLATGYSKAWLIGGLVGLALILPIAFMKNETLRRQPPASASLSGS